jgi:two-component system sensor histidine kinase/response regulator
VARTVSIYRSLLTSLLLVVVLLSAAVLTITFVQSRHAVAALSASAISGAMDEVEARLNRFFDPGSTGLLMMRDWGAEGRLDFDDTDQFVRSMSTVIDRNRQITSLMLADNSGRERMLLFTDGRWISRDSHADAWGERTLWTERPEPHAAGRSYEKKIDYDCRKRPWFRQALEVKIPTVRWTAPYTFFTTKDPGITASIRYMGPNNLPRVIGFDLTLQDITRFTMGLRPTPRGLAFVLTDDSRVLGLPGAARFAGADARQGALLKQPE